MPEFFNPTHEERQALDKLADEIPGIQQTLVANHKLLQHADRGAHQQQLAGGTVTLDVSPLLPPALNGLGIFHPSAHHVGIGRISTGLGCPHLETDPDFLGLMAAFRTPDGRRVDFITINDPTSPTNTPEEFIALLKATADAAGTEVPLGHVGSLDAGNVLASQARLLVSLARHAGTRAPAIATHVIAQTSRTVQSSSAYQPYWTGVVRARDVLGKFTFVPTSEINTARPITPGQRHLSADWRERQRAGALDFRLFWIPFISEQTTPLNELTRAWAQNHRVEVGMVTFPKIDLRLEEREACRHPRVGDGGQSGQLDRDERGSGTGAPGDRVHGGSLSCLPAQPEGAQRSS